MIRIVGKAKKGDLPFVEVARFEDTDDFFLTQDRAQELETFACGFWWGLRRAFQAQIEVEVYNGDQMLYRYYSGSWGGPDVAYR